MNATPRVVCAAAIGALLATTLPASAQALGVFRWQLQPYCNVVSLAVTQNGGIYTLDGTDDQCGASPASITGIAFIKPDGGIGFGLTVVSAPGGAPVHVDATITFPSLSGTWQDSGGRQGAFVLTPAAGTGGSPRPIGGGLGSSAVDAAQVQVRVSDSCTAGQAMAAIGQNGGVTCVAVNGGGGTGDITAVVAGAGLSGGAAAGDATLAVSFAGTGTLPAVARSDHTHGRALDSVSVGFGALSAAATGAANSAVGHMALANLTTGARNSTVGTGAMFSASTGSNNSALGFQSLNSLAGGNNNVAVGYRSLLSSTSYEANTAIGTQALVNLTTGGFNTAIGFQAGINLVSGANNLYLGNEGLANEGATIRIGSGLLHNRIFLGATRGFTTGVNNAVPVVIDSLGQLGTISSSRRTKEDIRDLGGVGLVVQRLRPVQFRYSAPFADGSKPVQYGLIAEEVAEVLPELVAYGADGSPETVKYHVLPTLLLEEVQRLQREIVALRATVDTLHRGLSTNSPQR